MNQTWLVTAFFFALLLVILYAAFLILSPFLTAITWALILAILVYPLYGWLRKAMRERANLAATTVVVIITLLLIIPGIELAWFLADETASLVQLIPTLLSDESRQEWLAKAWVQQLLGWWDIVSFGLVDLKINWKELLIQGGPVVVYDHRYPGQEHRAESPRFHNQLHHRPGHAFLFFARRSGISPSPAALAADGSRTSGPAV